MSQVVKRGIAIELAIVSCVLLVIIGLIVVVQHYSHQDQGIVRSDDRYVALDYTGGTKTLSRANPPRLVLYPTLPGTGQPAAEVRLRRDENNGSYKIDNVLSKNNEGVVADGKTWTPSNPFSYTGEMLTLGYTASERGARQKYVMKITLYANVLQTTWE